MVTAMPFRREKLEVLEITLQFSICSTGHLRGYLLNPFVQFLDPGIDLVHLFFQHLGLVA
jgi:hypothetical protein